MAEAAGIVFFFELPLRHADSDLVLELGPPECRILYPGNPNHFHVTANGTHDQRQKIHQESRIDAGGDDRDSAPPRGDVDFSSQPGGGPPGIGQFLAGGDHRYGAGNDFLDRFGDGGKGGDGGDDGRIRLHPVQQAADGIADDNAVGGLSAQFAEVFSLQCGIGVHGADEFEVFFVTSCPDSHQPDLSGTDQNQFQLSHVVSSTRL